MTSNVISGERRWASARRGGMTVLGKVAVPKPINLPSQKLENHGLDPNVEIVPKGTLSWGSRPSSAGSNAWGTSALSPSTDGSSSCSSHLVGRPSSGGGTRPSTAGSERAHESNVNVWSLNSRPSSASGVLASTNASSTSLRPRSAETRPGSSQLSRFAESPTDSSRAWSSSSKRIGSGNYGKDGFSLSSGDFPTLGSEKDESEFRKTTESQDHASHGRPGSSSGVMTLTKSVGISNEDDISRTADSKGNYWRKDCSSYIQDVPRPSMERSYGQPYSCQNPNRTPPNYEYWHGAPPVNPPGGGWYGRPPGPPPYGAPGRFPMEPFPYYGPRVPGPGLAHSQPLRPPGNGAHGHHPKNGDTYRPHMSESYIRPSMPMRPGFYPGPVPYEGCYRPPMGYCNPNERDMSFVGMNSGTPGFNNQLNPNNQDPNNSHPRPGECRAPDQVEPGHPHDPYPRPAECRAPDQVEPGRPHDPRGNQVLRKQNDCWNQNDERKWSHKVTTNVSNRDKGILSIPPLQANSWGDNHRKDEVIHYGKSTPVEQVPSQPCVNKFGSLDPADLKLPGRVNDVKDADMVPGVENAASPELIQKIEGLNAKARAHGVKQDRSPRGNQHDRIQVTNVKGSQSANNANSDVAERHNSTGAFAPVSCDLHIAPVDENCETMAPWVTAASRHLACGAQGRSNHHRGDNFLGQEAEKWSKRSELPTVISAAGSGSNLSDQVEKKYTVEHSAEVLKPNVVKGGEELAMPSFDPSDAQRAKMKEIAKQRAIQLQKEEEERTREQKAKALAKLKELDRRSANHGSENPVHKVETVPSHNGVLHVQEDDSNQLQQKIDADVSTKLNLDATSTNASTNERGASNTVGSTVSSKHVCEGEVEKTTDRNSVLSQNRLSTADVKSDDAASYGTTPQISEISKQKRLVHKQRKNILPEKSNTRDSIPDGRTDHVKVHKDTDAIEEINGDRVSSRAGRELTEAPHILGSSVQHKKRNKNGKNKHKIEGSSTAVSFSGTVAKDSNNTEVISDSTEQSASKLEISNVQPTVDIGNAIQSVSHSSLPYEDAHGKQNAWKPQHSRKPRNPQGNRSSEKSHSNNAVVWAPVPSHNNKGEATVESLGASAAGDNLGNNSPKTKRAEMERYVPKPVAKELALQGSVQLPSPSVDQSANDGTMGEVKASHVVKTVSKHADGKHRPGGQGSWRQRAQTSQDSSFAADTSKNSESHNESALTIKSNESLTGAPQSRSDKPLEKGQVDASDGWNYVDDSGSSSSAAFAGTNDHVLSGRGKKPPFKGNKGSATNHNNDHKVSIPLKENRAVGDHVASHWLPKSQGYASNSQKGNRSRGGQNFIVEESKTLKKEAVHNDNSHPSTQNNQGIAKDMTACEGKNGDGILSLEHQENNGGKLVSPNMGFHEVQCGPDNEQRPSSGYRRNVNYHNRFKKGHEPEADWSSKSQGNKQYDSANHEKQRPNSHYEYQPVGSYNNNSNRRSNESGPQIESQPGGPKFHKRGQNHSRRGGGEFYGKQRGNPSNVGHE